MEEDKVNKVNVQNSFKDKIHENLKIAFVVLGIVSFTLGVIINWHTVKRLK